MRQNREEVPWAHGILVQGKINCKGELALELKSQLQANKGRLGVLRISPDKIRFCLAIVAGLFFCLASAEGAGLLFCPAAIQPHTSVYSAFCVVHAVIPPAPQSSAQSFIGAFPEICPILPPQIPDRYNRL